MKRPLTLFFLLATTLIVSAAPKNILLIIADDYGVDSSSLCNSTNTGKQQNYYRVVGASP